MLQTTNYFSHIHPADYKQIKQPIFNVSEVLDVFLQGSFWFNQKLLTCTNHNSSNLQANKKLLNLMFKNFIEEYDEYLKEIKKFHKSAPKRTFENRHEWKDTRPIPDSVYFELCDAAFVACGIYSLFSTAHIIPLLRLFEPQQVNQKRFFVELMDTNEYCIDFHAPIDHARATVLSNASKFFPYNEKAQNAQMLTVWDSHKNAEISVKIAHNGTIGCLVDENGKVRKKAEFGYKTKEAFLLEIQNGKI